MSMKNLLDKYCRKPREKKIVFMYTRKELIALGRKARFTARSPRQG